jgi:hypothetical protein
MQRTGEARAGTRCDRRTEQVQLKTGEFAEPRAARGPGAAPMSGDRVLAESNHRAIRRFVIVADPAMPLSVGILADSAVEVTMEVKRATVGSKFAVAQSRCAPIRDCAEGVLIFGAHAVAGAQSDSEQ